MFRFCFSLIFLMAFNIAFVQSQEILECFYSDRVMWSLNDVHGGKVLSETKDTDQESEEVTYTHAIEFDNQDAASIEQKYCSMYNLSVTYKMKKLDERNFKKALDTIDEIARSVRQDYRLKAPLKSVVDMTMNQNKLSIDSAFDIGLPAQAVNSSEYVEHSIGFRPLAESDAFDAEIEFYFGLGGE